MFRDGSGLTPVTQVPGGIPRFQLAADGSALYYTVTKDHTIDAWKDLRNEFKDAIKFGHGIHQVSELWRLDLETWRAAKLVDETRFIRYFQVSPNQTRIAMITDPDQHLITHEGQSEVSIFDAASGTSTDLPDRMWREEAPSPFGWLENPVWSDDSQNLGFTIGFDGYPAWVFVASFGETGPQIQKIPRPDDVEVTGSLRWKPHSRQLTFLGDHRALERVYSVDIDTGKSEILTPGVVVVSDYSISPQTGQIAVVQSGQRYSGDLYIGEMGQKPERLVQSNPQIDTWKLPKLGLVQWTGANGGGVEGILELPPDYDGEHPLPLIVAIHGGPASAKFCFRYWIYHRTLFPAKGYAVLLPNYRGSTGYGDAFITVFNTIHKNIFLFFRIHDILYF